MTEDYVGRPQDFRQYNYSREFLLRFTEEFEGDDSMARQMDITDDPAASMFRELMLQYGDIRGYVESGFANGEMSSQEMIVLDALRRVRDRCIAEELEILDRAGMR